jgi:hypothetical protein
VLGPTGSKVIPDSYAGTTKGRVHDPAGDLVDPGERGDDSRPCTMPTFRPRRSGR